MNSKQRDALLATLQARFEQHPERHQGIAWADVEARLEAAPAKLKALQQMEETGGEPDVVGRENASGALLFFDCSAETPAGRRSLCYDREALDARKKDKPVGCATELAAQIGIELLDEAQYRQLQELGSFDRKTSSWLRTPGSMRKLDGALFGDRRYERVFTYHNGVQSYYAARGFRGVLKV